MKKAFVLITLFFMLMTILVGCSSSNDNYVVLSVLGTDGEPINGISVYEERYPDGREIFPGPTIGKTDRNGKLKWNTEKIGEQNLTVGYFNSAEQIEYMTVPITITKDDINQHREKNIVYTPQ